MRSTIRRLGWLLIAIPAALLAVFATAVSAAVVHLPPSCPGTQPYAENPPRACVDTTYASDAYSTPPVRTSLSVAHRLVRRGRYSYVAVTVRVGYSVALQECPGGGVPIGDIPCMMDSPNFGSLGRYSRGHRQLVLSPDAAASTPVCTQGSPAGVCTSRYRIYEDEFHGEDVEVFGLSVGELTQNPANDLGGGGFEFAVAVNVPAPPKPHR